MNDDKEQLEKQLREQEERTRQWERDRDPITGQELEDPQRAREWDQDKKPEK